MDYLFIPYYYRITLPFALTKDTKDEKSVNKSNVEVLVRKIPTDQY